MKYRRRYPPLSSSAALRLVRAETQYSAEQSTWETDARCGKEECDTSNRLKSRSRNALRIAYECDERVRHPLGLSLSLSLSP